MPQGEAKNKHTSSPTICTVELMVVFELYPEKTLPELLQEITVLKETICGSEKEVKHFTLKSPGSKKIHIELKEQSPHIFSQTTNLVISGLPPS